MNLYHPREPVEFVFQMGGKRNLYGGGTNLTTKLPGLCNGEKNAYLYGYTWTEDDDIPGQMKIYLSDTVIAGKNKCKLYLNDGSDSRKKPQKKK